MDIYIEGLEIYGHHGVDEEERVLGQRLVYDIRLTLEECKAAQTDSVRDTIDYTEVIDLVTEVATVNSFFLLERLAQVTAESILAKFPVDEVWVQVTKPHPPVACALSSVSAAVELRREQ
ncbi:MAG: dihydroneopterin aldolase [Thermoleophilia bacterium]|nr:dihydroneopterin aldolase [Thermoleophilia bacterium]